jgi:hypothetical protein
MQHRDRGHLATYDKPLQAAADYLNLRQFRHCWATAGLARAGVRTAVRVGLNDVA